MKNDRQLLPQKMVELFTGRPGAKLKASVNCEATSVAASVPNDEGGLDQVMFLYSGVRDANGEEIWIPESAVRNRLAPGSSMTRAEWLAECIDEIVSLRPQLGGRLAEGVARASFVALGSRHDPRKVALEFHLHQESLTPKT